jgi:hypothetical protein
MRTLVRTLTLFLFLNLMLTHVEAKRVAPKDVLSKERKSCKRRSKRESKDDTLAIADDSSDLLSPR